MIRSMTAYARAETPQDWGRLSWELRSVNHRYLDVQFRLPEEFRPIENELRQLAADQLGRGKVEAQLRYTLEGAALEAVEIDAERIAQLKHAVDGIEKIWGALGSPDAMRILAWPGVVRQQQPDFAPLHAVAIETFAAALRDFTETRSREGARLAELLRERCDTLLVLVEQVQARLPQVRELWFEKLRARCAELQVEVDSARLEQELAIAAQRLDVDEEMSRLRSHVTEVQDVLDRKDAVGRRLDFLMQELNREANTLSSKSQDAEMTRCAVEMKVLIEQMREQVQNIE